MTGLWGRRASIAGAALIIAAGIGISAVTVTSSPARTTVAQGIDVSSHEHPGNSVINWPLVAAAGNVFTAIKASEATYYVNPYFVTDADRAAAAGLYVMPYAFANPFPAKGNGSAREQADAAARQLSSAAVPGSQLLPLALDIEPDPYAARQRTNQCYGLSQAAMVTWIKQFMSQARLKTGKKPVIYTTTAWWRVCTGNSAAFGAYPLWIASYGKSRPVLPPGWRNYTFWQHTSKGSVPGIAGSATDQDYFGRPAATSITSAQFQALASAR